jgi:hypothetical protein
MSFTFKLAKRVARTRRGLCLAAAVISACAPDGPRGITDPTRPSPSPSAALTAPAVNECATPQPGWIWCDDFEQNRLASYFEYDNSGGNFAPATGVGLNASTGMRGQWAAAGQTGAGALHLAFGKTPQSYFRPVDAGTAVYRDVYWRVYVKNQPGWVGGGADKLSRAMSLASSSSWAQAMIAHVWSGPASNQNYLLMDPASGTDATGNLKTTTYNDFANLTWLGAGNGVTPMFDAGHVGQWYCVEARARLNDVGQTNGVFQLWINSTLETQRTGLNWLGSFPSYGINALFLENFWNAGAPQPEERYFDNLVVSTQPIGCGSASPPPPVTAPGSVTDLAVAGKTDTSITLSFTEVSDGTGAPASYDIRYAAGTLSWGSAALVSRGSCATPVAGTAIGGKPTCTVLGLAASTGYEFQLVPFRGALNGNAVFGSLSNVASGGTTASGLAPVVSVTVSPVAVSQPVGATQQLTATLKDASGNLLAGRAVTWTSSSAVVTVGATGLETGVTGGSATITAMSEGISGTSAVTVTTAQPGSVGDLVVTAVTDSSVTLSFTDVSTGAGQVASYDVRFAPGTLSWGSAAEVGRGSCATPVAGTAIGVKRTCTVLGLRPSTGYQVQLVPFRGVLNVNAVFGALSNVASGTTMPGSPGTLPSGGGWPNEPTGFTGVTDYSFNNAIPATQGDVPIVGGNGWNSIYNGNGYVSLTTDAGAPFSAPSVLDFYYPVGFPSSVAPGTLYYDFGASREMYVGLWWKPSNPWQGNDAGRNKICYLATATGKLIALEMFNQSAPYKMGVVTEFPGDNRAIQGTTTVALGQWHRVEWYLKYSSSSSTADGVMKVWLDGVLDINRTDLIMPADAGFGEFQLSPTFGGNGVAKTEADHFWFDHAHLSHR